MIAKIDAEFNRLIGFTADTRGSISAADHEQRKATLNHFASAVHDFGGADRDRTDDPLLAKQVLSQLSYSPGPVRRNVECLMFNVE